MKRLKIVENYLRSWFLIDLLAWLPIDFMFDDLLRWNCLLRAMKIPLVAGRVWMRTHTSVDLKWRGNRILRPETFDRVILGTKGLLLVTLFLFALHLHACTWVACVSIDQLQAYTK